MLSQTWCGPNVVGSMLVWASVVPRGRAHEGGGETAGWRTEVVDGVAARLGMGRSTRGRIVPLERLTCGWLDGVGLIQVRLGSEEAVRLGSTPDPEETGADRVDLVWRHRVRKEQRGGAVARSRAPAMINTCCGGWTRRRRQQGFLCCYSMMRERRKT
jgi:hypothetical protein